MSTVDDVPNLTPNQILALLVLMAEARQLDNNELKELAGFSITGDLNTKLEKTLGLIETDRSHRPYAHQLSDEGWRVARVLHTSAPPRQGGSASRSIFTLLANLHRALEQLGSTHGVKLSVGEFFQHKATAAERVEEPDPVPNGGRTAEQRVRAAYADLADRPGDWVGLADLRDRLPDLDRAAVDGALMALLDQDGVRIIPAANTKALRTEDRAAAIRIGGEDNHALSIGQS